VIREDFGCSFYGRFGAPHSRAAFFTAGATQLIGLKAYDLFLLPQVRDFNHEAHEEHEGGFAAEKRGLATKNAKKGGDSHPSACFGAPHSRAAFFTAGATQLIGLIA
jgi:hypothetical protein